VGTANYLYILLKFAEIVSTGVMSNISPQKNARTPEQNISLRNLCKNLWLEETAILDMQMGKLTMISGYTVQTLNVLFKRIITEGNWNKVHV
jgi:predicted transcriptional regulator